MFVLYRADIDFGSDEPAPKKMRINDNEETDFSMASLAKGVVKEVRYTYTTNWRFFND